MSHTVVRIEVGILYGGQVSNYLKEAKFMNNDINWIVIKHWGLRRFIITGPQAHLARIKHDLNQWANSITSKE